MHLLKIILSLCVFNILLSTATEVYGQPSENTDKTLSPYFFVKSDDPGIDQLPLKSTSADVNVVGVMADVVVTQV